MTRSISANGARHRVPALRRIAILLCCTYTNTPSKSVLPSSREPWRINHPHADRTSPAYYSNICCNSECRAAQCAYMATTQWRSRPPILARILFREEAQSRYTGTVELLQSGAYSTIRTRLLEDELRFKACHGIRMRPRGHPRLVRYA